MPAQHSATDHAIDMNPQTTTRQVWTDTLTSPTPPSDAHAKWAAMWTASQNLMKALFDHLAMEPNRQQTFGTPANSKNSVYFIPILTMSMQWYTGRTPHTLQNMRAAEKEMWTDVITRSFTTIQLILDTKPGMLKTMIEGTYPGRSNASPAMGEEVLQATREL